MRVSNAKVVKRLSDYFSFRWLTHNGSNLCGTDFTESGSRFQVTDFPHNSEESNGYYLVIDKPDFTRQSILLGPDLIEAQASIDEIFFNEMKTDTDADSDDWGEE